MTACAAGDDAGAADQAVSAKAPELSLRCGEDAVVVIRRSGDTFGVRATQGKQLLFDVANKVPSLNVRLEDGTRTEVDELIDFGDAGLEVVPVDGPTALEIDLDRQHQVVFKNGDDVKTLSCSFTKAEVLRYFAFDIVDAQSWAKSLDESRPQNVAFDIDDTLAFTTPAFLRGIASGGAPTPTDESFWFVTNACDPGCPAGPVTLPDGTVKDLPASAASTAKASARALVKFHQERGDHVYAITARPDVNASALRTYVERELGIPAGDVFFEPDFDQPGNPKGKTDKIEALKLDVFYGDSDSDISDAQKAFAADPTHQVTPVRFFRSPKSSNRKGTKLNKYHPGYFGEAIIAGSYE